MISSTFWIHDGEVGPEDSLAIVKGKMERKEMSRNLSDPMTSNVKHGVKVDDCGAFR